MTDGAVPESLVLVQDLVNTLDVETGRDELAPDAGSAEFAERNGLADLGLTVRDRPALRTLREGLRAACLAHTGTTVPAREVAALQEQLSRAPLVLGMDDAGHARLYPAPRLTGMRGLTARIAADIAGAPGDWRRLKVCEAHDCRWAFYDRSPAGRRRWCDMAVCGSRAKMRAYRAKRAGGGESSGPGTV